MYVVRNLTKEIVWDTLEKMRDKKQLPCSCDKCLADMLTYALNHLPPVYVTNDSGTALGQSRVHQTQFTTDVLMMITQAIQVIGEHPKHSDEYVMVRNTSESFFICDANGIIVSATRQASYLTGLKPDRLVGKLIIDFISKEQKELKDQILLQIQRGIAASHECLIHYSGNTYRIYFHLSPIVENEKNTGAIILIRKIQSIRNENLEDTKAMEDFSDIIAGIEEIEKIRTSSGSSEAKGQMKSQRNTINQRMDEINNK